MNEVKFNLLKYVPGPPPGVSAALYVNSVFLEALYNNLSLLYNLSL